MAKYSTVVNKGITYYRWIDRSTGKRKEITARTVDELDDKVYEYKKLLEQGLDINSKNITVATWANEWVETYKKPAVIDKSYRNYKSIIANYIIPAIGLSKLSDVTNSELQNLINSAASSSRSHAQHIKNTITGLFSRAMVNKKITSNPALGLIIPRSAVAGTHRALTAQETDLFLRVIKSSRHRIFACLMYYCGLRDGECAALKVKDIDYVAGVINVSQAVESNTKKIKGNKNIKRNAQRTDP